MRGSSQSSPRQSTGGMDYHPEGYSEHDQLPIVYNDAYNISFYGLEKVHPFDAGKWGKVFAALRRAGLLTDSNFYKPHEATEEELLVVHPPAYINKLRWSAYVATVTEVPLVAMLPNCVVQRRVLRPFRYQTAGTVLAARLALDHGWAIHLGGGFHHASANRGGGFCCYADITLAVRELRRRGKIKHVIVVDLDAHQGNGYERDFLGDQDVYIMDVYNRAIYPNDEYAKGAIRRKVELRPGTSDEAYLKLVDDHLQMSLAEFDADLIVYNAGTDVLSGDMLGHLNISEKSLKTLKFLETTIEGENVNCCTFRIQTPKMDLGQGVVKRDELVFRRVRKQGLPVVMLTSGGYQRQSARVIASSVLNLCRQGLLARRPPRRRASSSMQDRSSVEDEG